MYLLNATLYNVNVIFDVETIIQWGGLLAITLIVFAESGLLFGFILPGDTLLLTAGFFAAQGQLPIAPLVILIVFAAIIGDNVGYYTGKKLGPKVFKRKDGILFRQEYIERAQAFYEKHGGKTIIIARFFPAIRTFAPIVAGVGKMKWGYFAAYNVVGALLWGAGVTMLGYAIGSTAPGIDGYLFAAVIIVAHGFLFFIVYQLLKTPETRKQLKQSIKEEYHHFFKRKK